MSFNPQDKTASGPMVPNPEPGVVPARVARIVEIGEHDTKWGKKKQVYLWYTLPTRIINLPESESYHGKQHMVRTKPLRLSSSEKAALMKDHINILCPTITSLDQMLGQTAFVNLQPNSVTTDGETTEYINIMQVSAVPEGIDVLEGDTEYFYFSYSDPDATIWQDKLWDHIREKIMSANDYKGSAVEEMVLRLAAMQA